MMVCDEDHPDLVTSMIPGYPADAAPLSSCWYSGYLHYEVAGQQVHTHYTLMTAESVFDDNKLDNDDDSDNSSSSSSRNTSKPLIYWSSYVLHLIVTGIPCV